MVELKGEALNLFIYDFDKLSSLNIEDRLMYKITTEKGTELTIELNINEKKIQIEYYEKFQLKEKRLLSFKDFVKSLLKTSVTEETTKKVETVVVPKEQKIQRKTTTQQTTPTKKGKRGRPRKEVK